MTVETRPTVGADTRSAPAAKDAEIDLVFAIDPFHDALTALIMAITTAESAPTAGAESIPALRAAVTLVRAAAGVVTERAATLEQAARSLLMSQTAL